jgi:hypothetical protein
MNRIVRTSKKNSTSIEDQKSNIRNKLGIKIIEITESKDFFSIVPNRKSVSCRIVEFEPNTRKVLFHQTDTIDYGIVLEGEIELLMENERLLLCKNDCFIQEGKKHAWVNSSEIPCRIFFVLVDKDHFNLS